MVRRADAATAGLLRFCGSTADGGGPATALNVLSNLPFIVSACCSAFGFFLDGRSAPPGVFEYDVERGPYWVYFVGLVLTGIGSSYFHADPCNATLTWDRAGLAIAFMALFTSILAERVHVALCRAGHFGRSFCSASAVSFIGITPTHRRRRSTFLFHRAVLSARHPAGAAVLLSAALHARRRSLAALLCYVLAKGLEILDREVYTGAGFVSGHTLKHLVASLEPASFC